MFKTIIQTVAGIVFIFGGISIIYVFIINLNTNANLFFLALSIFFLCGGIYFFIKAGKSDSTVISRVPPMKSTLFEEKSGLSERLAKNNEIMGNWKKVNETKDRLRMIEISASGGSENNQ
ncbi:MAG TPA: hypothetical protein VNW29_07065 [Candidatus Sulfotelmatobacter sp.]|jgi:hypothetical protein|nr:hypothetical protein [Candidatus Sulfotelmatobacter sp.]